MRSLPIVVAAGEGRVNADIESLYHAIGQEALASAPDIGGRLLVYAEVQDGVVSADLFYVQSPKRPIRFRFCTPAMRDLIVSLWEKWQGVPGNREWRVMCYVIDGGKFNIDLTYPDQLNEDEGLPDRRPHAIRRYFGEVSVDYSSPR